MSLIHAATLLIVACTIGGIAVGRWPLLRANRTIITLLGAALLLGIGALTLRRDPIPYLLGLATAANVSSVATITGNPQNIVVGNASGISYGAFTAALAPTALIGLAICWLVIMLSYRLEFRSGAFVMPEG